MHVVVMCHAAALQKVGVDMKLLARATVIDLVMCTDMKQHFSIMSRLQVSHLYRCPTLSSQLPSTPELGVGSACSP